MKTALTHMPFKRLEETIRKKKIVLSNKEIVTVKTDEEIFDEAMADVREIIEFRKIAAKQPPKIAPLPPKDSSLDDLTRLIKGETKIKISYTGEYIEWIRPDTRKDIVRKLHEGDFSVQDYIDLHGMTLIEAEEALFLFFKEALRKRLFCVKVIHGRGLRSPKGPVLKVALEKWLRGQFRKSVLAYSTARDCDGGLGATYIILKSG